LAAQTVSTPYQGFGAQTLGGQGKPVYPVTNLNDSGTGSLRDALSQGNRHIVFDVAGDILLKSNLVVRGANVTLDGFTAPSPGITLRNYGLIIHGKQGAHDIIVRAIRVRNVEGNRDGIQIAYGAYNVIIDHVSIQGSGDGNLDITYDSHDVTVSWSILTKPADEEKNMLIKYDPSRITLHHNLFLHALQRNPQVRIDDAGTPAKDTTVDMRNNLVWGWKGGHGTLIWYGPRVNVVENFYSAAGGDPKRALQVSNGARAYVAGNFSNDGLTDYINARGTEATPFQAPLVDTVDACTAAHLVLAEAGVRPLDTVDQKYLSTVELQPCGIVAKPTLEVSPKQLNFSTTFGGSNPAPQTLSVMSSNGSDLSWAATAGGTWLSLSPVSGTGPSTVTVGVKSSNLPVGSHLGWISIAAPDAQASPLQVPVTLTVSPAPGTTPTPVAVDFKAEADTYIDQSHPTTNYGSANSIAVGGNPYRRDIYVRFNVSGLPAGALVTDAELIMRASNGSGAPGGGGTIRKFAPVVEQWNESQSTWNNPLAGSDASSDLSTIGPVSSGKTYFFIGLQSAVPGNGRVTFVIRSPQEDGAAYRSREYGTASQRPTLRITYIPQ
jgi:hypothetical protein